jgi:mannosyltransferase
MGGKQSAQGASGIDAATFENSRASAGALGREAPRSLIAGMLLTGERGQRWVVAGLCALAFLLCMPGLDAQSLWRDEVDAIRFALRPLPSLFETFTTAGQNGPLYSLVLRPWLGMAGDSAVALRFFSLFWGVLAVPLVFRVGRRLFPSHSVLPVIAALLAATSPYLAWYGQEGKMYSLVVALVLLSMDRYLGALESGGWARWLAYVAVTSALFYLHFVAALIVPAQALLYLFLARKHWGERRIPWLASMTSLSLPYLPLFAWQVPLLLKPADTGFQFVPLPKLVYSLLTSYSLGVVWSGAPWVLALFVGLMLAGVALLWRERRLRAIPAATLATWLAVPVLVFFAVTLVRPLFTARYLIFVLPAFLLLVAAGLTAIAAHSRLLAVLLLGAVLASNGRGLWQQATTPVKADFRGATRYVAERLEQGDLILFQIPYGRYSFDYYFPRVRSLPPAPDPKLATGHHVFLPLALASAGDEPYRWADGLYTNEGMAPELADKLMAEMTAGSHVVWFVGTETSLWDDRGLVQGWLDEHGARTDEAQFTRVEVVRYELP